MKRAPVQHKGTHRSLVTRLRDPIDPKRNVIDAYNAVSNVGLRQLADKLDAIGEALAYLIEKKHMKKQVQKAKRGRT